MTDTAALKALNALATGLANGLGAAPRGQAPVNVFAAPQPAPRSKGLTAKPAAGTSANNQGAEDLLDRMREQANPNSIENALMRQFRDVAQHNGWTVKS